MAGNELDVCRFILSNLKSINLRHIGQVEHIAAPLNIEGTILITCPADLLKVSTSDARKKADIYLNGKGISIKQKGPSVLYNRLQRVNLPTLYQNLNFTESVEKINQLDCEILRFHRGEIIRDRHWQSFFSEKEFKILLQFLMLIGSPNYGISKHPAEFILEAPFSISDVSSIQVYSFDEYFNKYKQYIRIAIRRSWVGQISESEHRRALSISKKIENSSWVFYNNISEPPSGWRVNFPTSERRTVYYLMFTKVSN